MCQAGSWKNKLETLGNVFGKLGPGDGVIPGLGGGGRDHACRCGHKKLAGAWFAALRKVDLHKGLASPLDEWDLGKTQKAHPFEW